MESVQTVTMLSAHVDELGRGACSIHGAFDDGVRRTDERVDGPVGGQTRIDIEQVATVGCSDGIGDRLDHLTENATKIFAHELITPETPVLTLLLKNLTFDSMLKTEIGHLLNLIRLSTF